MTPCLEFDQVEVCYGGKPVVQDISFQLEKGQILGLVGQSGSGKSTLLRSAVGLLGPMGKVTKGTIAFQGQNIGAMSPRALQGLRGGGMGMIFQDAGASLCPVRTIGSQILEAMAAHGKTDPRQAKKEAMALFELLSLPQGERIWSGYPFALSGGMNQRVGIAMAMLLKPAVLLADEPTSALDVGVQRQVIQALLDLRSHLGTAIVLVTHDIGVVSCAADTMLVLKDGRCQESGPVATVLSHPQSPYTQALLAAAPKLRRP